MKPYNEMTLRDLVNRELFIDPVTGEIDLKYNPMNVTEDIFLPQRSVEYVTINFTVTPTGALFENGGSC